MATKDLIQLDWGSLGLVLLVSSCAIWRHLMSGGMSHRRSFTTQLVLELLRLLEAGESWGFAYGMLWSSSLSHSHSPPAAQAFLTQQWPTGRRPQRSKPSLQLHGSPVDCSLQVRPVLCAVNCVTLMNLLNQDQKHVCPILASVKSTKSKAIFH